MDSEKVSSPNTNIARDWKEKIELYALPTRVLSYGWGFKWARGRCCWMHRFLLLTAAGNMICYGELPRFSSFSAFEIPFL